MQKKQTFSSKTLNLSNQNYELRKYRILEMLNQLPTDENKLYKKQIPKNLDINRQTWSNWLNASISDKIEVPSIKLAIIAYYLKTDVESLINIPINPPPIKSEIEINQENILKTTGLTK